ncbi:hypothetical protein [Roseicyclus sp.]|uniref:hypothetical protein n=1 Tax=Roseicyclus sp. TaxID=1914329 RepID=UPI003F6AF4FF
MNIITTIARVAAIVTLIACAIAPVAFIVIIEHGLVEAMSDVAAAFAGPNQFGADGIAHLTEAK